MRTLTLAGFALLLCACQHRRACGTHQLHGFALGPTPPRQIAVGDRRPKARERILGSGGKDISRTIGDIPYGFWMYWFVLKDGTCLCVSVPAPDEDVIQGLELGEPGRGYGDKLKWGEQKRRDVKLVDPDKPY